VTLIDESEEAALARLNAIRLAGSGVCGVAARVNLMS
jgi:hypothetical protein